MVLKFFGLWKSSSASAWILEQLARMVRGASLLGSTRLNKRKRGLRRVTIESPVPGIGHDRRDHSEHRVTGRCLVSCQGIPAEEP
jgi:hypothetical protein